MDFRIYSEVEQTLFGQPWKGFQSVWGARVWMDRGSGFGYTRKAKERALQGWEGEGRGLTG